MSLIDQAFIKAYAKDSPASRDPALTPVLASPRAPLGERAATRQPLPTTEQLYADGSLYRLESPPAAEAPAVPAPHYGIKVPAPSRRLSRRVHDGRPEAGSPEPAVSNDRRAVLIEPPARRSFARSLLDIAQRLNHPPLPEAPEYALPVASPAPAAEQSPETIHESHPHEKDAPTRPQPAAPAAPPPAPAPAVPPASWNLLPESAVVHADWDVIAAPAQLVLPDVHDFEITAAAENVDWLDLATVASDAPEKPAKDRKIVAANETPEVESHHAQTDAPKYRLDAAHAPAAPEPHLPVAEAAEPAEAANADAPEAATAVDAAEYELAAAVEPLPELPAVDAVSPATPCVPLWEVDRFMWPETCDKLLHDEQSYFSQAGGKLLAAVNDGLKTLAITGSRRGEGRTTLALCLARCAAAAGMQVALIDADFSRPQLAATIGLEVAYGWQDAALGKIPLAEAAIKSLADKITVFPLEPAAAGTALTLGDPRVTATLRAAAATFELLIVDLGPTTTGHEPLLPDNQRCPLDAVIVVRDMRYASAAESAAVGQRLYAAGVEAVGIAENFVAE